MVTVSPQPDVVIVGGGIAGTALAAALARDGVDVVVLERDEPYRERNKGEVMVPWGWRDAAALGLSDVLVGAGGITNAGWIATAPDGEATHIPVAALAPDRGGSLSLGHVDARHALAEAAIAAGADVRFGVSSVDVDGAAPEVRWEHGGQRHRVRPRLVVGADGRGSRVRRQLGLRLERTARTHVVASLLVGNVPGLGDDVRVTTRDGRLTLAIPLAGDRARIYLVSRGERFTGVADGRRMLDVFRATTRQDAPVFDDAEPIGACATYGGEDTWVRSPVSDHAVLVGDAAGYNSPIIGQGLSLAMRDARLVAQAMGGSDQWSRETFAAYAAERTERLRRVRFTAQLWAELRLGTNEEVQRVADDPAVQPLLVGIFAGYDDAPAESFSDGLAASLLARARDRPPVGT